MFMRGLEIAEILQNYNKSVFTLKDIAKITGKPRKYLSLLLSKNKMFKRIERGKYCLKEASIYVIASNIIYPSYVSLLSALRYYNLVTQMPNVVYVVATRQHKVINFDGYSIKFIKFSRNRVFGYKNDDGANVACPEKAIIDSLYEGLDYSYVAEAFKNIEDADIEKLKSYAINMDSKILINKLGFLLESSGFDASSLITHRSSRYAVISPGKKINTKWRVKHA